ncbi:hypothetical protein C8Q80DRAFT_773974 [Daedaleopsis nitida]|nr:hypothetical protein C8Q80DRAFT_773974 [Daedaleopsis nitida]
MEGPSLPLNLPVDVRRSTRIAKRPPPSHQADNTPDSSERPAQRQRTAKNKENTAPAKVTTPLTTAKMQSWRIAQQLTESISLPCPHPYCDEILHADDYLSGHLAVHANVRSLAAAKSVKCYWCPSRPSMSGALLVRHALEEHFQCIWTCIMEGCEHGVRRTDLLKVHFGVAHTEDAHVWNAAVHEQESKEHAAQRKAERAQRDAKLKQLKQGEQQRLQLERQQERQQKRNQDRQQTAKQKRRQRS